MQSVREKILNAIEEALTGADDSLAVAVSVLSPDSGRLYAQRGLRTLVTIAFEFQPKYCMLALSGELVARSDARRLPDSVRYNRKGIQFPDAAEYYFIANYENGWLFDDLLGLIRMLAAAGRQRLDAVADVASERVTSDD